MLDSIFQEDIDKAKKGGNLRWKLGLSIGFGDNGGQHWLLRGGEE